jgi:alpha-L-fucosidase 2
MNPPWQSKYTININTEMNYWPAEVCNLGECVEPLIAMLNDLSVTGARTAQEMYDARGWVAHHNTDLWRATGPIDFADAGMWPSGGAWLCDHLWDRYQYTGDKKYLKEAYPVMRGAAQFFLDTLQEDPTNHWLVTCPSISPENQHPFGSAVCAGPAMDEEILRGLFSNCIEANKILNTDPDFRKQLEQARSRLAPIQIGKQGQIQEWLGDWDAQAREQLHRHISHLYALFPSAQITPRGTPELAEAAKVTLNKRGDIPTGWAMAWRINCWARLHDGDRAFSILNHLFDPSRTYPNMLTRIRRFRLTGTSAAHPRLPKCCCKVKPAKSNCSLRCRASGPAEASKACVRGGFELDRAWVGGKLSKAVIKSVGGRTATVRYGDRTTETKMKPGASIQLNSELQPAA